LRKLLLKWRRKTPIIPMEVTTREEGTEVAKVEDKSNQFDAKIEISWATF
jgi:hypothetical protein